MRLGITVLIFAAALAVSGCVTPETLGDYFHYRRQDLIDVAHVDFSLFSYGASIFMTPLVAGCSVETGWGGGPADVLEIGLGGWRTIERKGVLFGTVLPPVYPMMAWRRGRPKIHDPDVLDRSQMVGPAPGTLGAHVGLFLGVTVQVSAGELIDLLAGLFCLDPSFDDFHYDPDEDKDED